MEHRHRELIHDHEIDEGLAIGPAVRGKRSLLKPVEDPGPGMHTFYNLFHLSVACDCGYRGEIDTYGEYGFWWKWFLHVHAHDGHSFTIQASRVITRNPQLN